MFLDAFNDSLKCGFAQFFQYAHKNSSFKKIYSVAINHLCFDGLDTTSLSHIQQFLEGTHNFFCDTVGYL